MPLQVGPGRILATGVTLLLCGLTILWAWRTFSKPAVEAQVQITAAGVEIINRGHAPWPQVMVYVNGKPERDAYSFRVQAAVPPERVSLILFESFTKDGKNFDVASQPLQSVRLAVPGFALTRFDLPRSPE